MTTTMSKPTKSMKYRIGCTLAYAYIFTSYVAQDLLISSRLNSIVLYIFLIFSAYLFLSKKPTTKIDLNKNGFFVWYIAFMIMSAVLMLFSPSISGVFNSFYSMGVALLVSMCLRTYTKTENGFRNICRCYTFSSFAFIVLLFFTGNMSGSADDRLGEQLLGNANIFASMMMFGTIFSIWLLVFDSPSILRKFIMLAIISFQIYSLMLSGGRKFLLIPFIFLYLLFMNKTNKKGKKHIIFYTLLFTVIIIFVWFLIMNVPVLYNSIGIRMEGLIYNLQGVGGDSSSVLREQLRNLAVKRWWQNPFVVYGFDSFKYYSLEMTGRFYYSHCNYTELLYNGGLLYLILYYSIFIVIMKRCFKNKELPSKYKAFIIAVVISFLIFDYGAVSYNLTLEIMFLMLAYDISSFKKITCNGEKIDGENKDLCEFDIAR